MRKWCKVILIVLSSLLGVVGLLVVIFFWSLSNYYKKMSVFSGDFVVEYRTSEDLSAIAGVSVPRAELIDSCFIDHYSMGGYTVKAMFSVKPEDHRSLLRKLSKESVVNKRWAQGEEGFSMFFYPDLHDDDWSDGIDDRKVEVDGRMVDDWDGTFFGMAVPKDSSIIILEYGWIR